ncbi:calmodulin-binding transcription activator 3-like isoform X1 [Dendrobium catenatum]|uniref:calmodulin-binding transcription activator 3-like isoform X1 n=1 Tax=Dendrobium catenatum TaxID=906689 RepID=UPI0009F17F9F|nr:calmodulin-binding transcription activator 3-like isoform X1 [Dendrobium catenatum]
MADGRRLGLTPQLDIEQILREAQHRWLRPAEICEILRNYHKFRIAPEPQNKPPSGSLFLFDRKVLRYFRKDGHNWRKKKDGKTVKEAHEKLKAGSVDVLHCYYAHGEDNENFQRRSYWMLEEELMHIVLVHYREVKGGKSSYLQQREDGESVRNSNPGSPACSNSSVNLSQVPSQVSDYGSPISTQHSEYEDADSADNYQSSSRYHSIPEMQQYGSWMNVQLANTCAPAPTRLDHCDYPGVQAAIPDFKSFTDARDSMTKVENPSDAGFTYSGLSKKTDTASWHEIMESCSTEFQTPFDLSISSKWATTSEDNPERNSFMNQDFLTGDISTHKEDGTTLLSNIVWQFSDNEAGSLVASSTTVENSHATEESFNQPSDLSNKKSEGLTKNDSFSRWMSKELGEVDNSQINLNSGLFWSSLESESVVADSNLLNQEQLDAYLMGPSLSQDQLFSIIDFSPNWAYADLVTKVIVKGRFLVNEEDLQKYKWSCMFGEIEVPANILANGTLCCHAPPHKSGRVPFYITCSNRVACSEIREFEYKLNLPQIVGTNDLSNSTLLSRFEKLLLLDSVDYLIPDCGHLNERSHADCTICSLIMKVDDEVIDLFKHNPDEDLLRIATKNRALESQMKRKLHLWLLHKVGEGDGKGPNVLDKEGQGVLHLAAALGYDWAIKPTVAAGVNINFRDVHGWTAMHWAAFCGRERTIVTLIALDASPGALTDPTPEFPTGRTPADLASQNGHKGIAGFLAESSLTNHLRALNLKNSENQNLSKPYGLLGFENVSDKINAHYLEGEIQTSLSAVRNATEAAARIFQVFRVQSFNRKRIVEHSDEKYEMSDERALSLISLKPYKSGQHDTPVHAAAIKIQNKFRGWKGRKEFLITRQRIVKIQAHVRGHQVRKHYRKIIWSVGIVEKVILRWRRKGSGLRGFRSEELIEGQKNERVLNKEDDYDFLQVGRKQTEARMEKALARVKSMVQYPEARDQYRRLVTVVTELQESKLMQADSQNEISGPSDADFMMELEGLIGDYDIMPNQS